MKCIMYRIIFLIGVTLVFSSCNQIGNNMDTLELMRKEIILSSCPVLFDEEITAESLAKNWTSHHSEWWLEDGWLHGKNPGNHPGMLILNKVAKLMINKIILNFFIFSP